MDPPITYPSANPFRYCKFIFTTILLCSFFPFMTISLLHSPLQQFPNSFRSPVFPYHSSLSALYRNQKPSNGNGFVSCYQRLTTPTRTPTSLLSQNRNFPSPSSFKSYPSISSVNNTMKCPFSQQSPIKTLSINPHSSPARDLSPPHSTFFAVPLSLFPHSPLILPLAFIHENSSRQGLSMPL